VNELMDNNLRVIVKDKDQVIREEHADPAPLSIKGARVDLLNRLIFDVFLFIKGNRVTRVKSDIVE